VVTKFPHGPEPPPTRHDHGEVMAVGRGDHAGQAAAGGDHAGRSIPVRAGHADIRRNNLEVVLRHLWAVGPDSRAAIAARAGLTRATVSRLVAELIDLGLVTETGPPAGRRPGRPGTQLALSGRHMLAIGAEINVDYIAVLAVDLANREIYQRRRAFDAQHAGPAASLRALAAMCEQCLATVAVPADGQPQPAVAGLGVAIPGLVDEAARVVSCAPNLSWDDVPVLPALGEPLAGRLGVVTVGNDANRAAVAEYRVGRHAGTPNLVYVTGEVGIGGGMIVHGTPLLGSRGYGGEVGHMTLDPAGPACGCGRRGCWEAYVGLNALLASLGVTPAGPSPKGDAPEDKIAAIVARARDGDRRTLAALAGLGRYLGIGAANIAKILNPEVIILGGYFAALGEWILPPATESFRGGLLAPDATACELATSTLGFMAAARGAAINILDTVLSNPHRLLPMR
jgi:predicted NBD/HSP70 family sugar kinase